MRRSKYFSTVVTIFVIIGIILFLAWATVIRDYTFKQVGGSWQFVARISVPTPSGITVDTSEEERVTVKCSNLGSQVHSYEFQISPFKNMAFAKVYGTEVPRQRPRKRQRAHDAWGRGVEEWLRYYHKVR